MRISSDFVDRIRKNDIYRKAYQCMDCGACANVWPSEHRCSLATRYQGSEACARGMNWIMQSLLEDRLAFSPGLVDFVFRCTTCNQCVLNCIYRVETRTYIEALRKDLVEEGNVPKTVMKVLEYADLYGNVWGKPKEQRSNWADGLGIRTAAESPGFEYLLFIGDSSSYVERNQETARKFIEILNRAGVSFAFLGNEERSSGNEILRLGEEGLFEVLAEENIANFKKYSVKKIVALSPHGYHALKNEYPKLDPGFDAEVVHCTQFLAGLLKDGNIRPKGTLKKKVTFQDSCYLGKHNSIYAEPREILQAIPGLELIEMDCSGPKGVCCGGGGGGVWMERGDGVDPENIRFAQAADMNVDILVTACPICTQMLQAAKEDFGEHPMEVRDVIELLYEVL